MLCKTKAKNDSLWQAGTLSFAALWAGSYGVAWAAMVISYPWISNISFLSSQQQGFARTVLVTLIPALLQVPLVERVLKHSMRGWVPLAVIGSFLTAFLYNNNPRFDGPSLLLLLTLFLPMALLQAAWLWRRVQSVWLWLLATMAASLVFDVPLRGNAPLEVLVIAILLYGLVQGVTMHYLWMQPKDTEKTKHESAEDELISQERLPRLEEAEETAQPSIHDDASVQRKIQ